MQHSSCLCWNLWAGGGLGHSVSIFNMYTICEFSPSKFLQIQLFQTKLQFGVNGR